jgi:hypothetical protein
MFKLTEFPPVVRYSLLERQIFEMLPQDGSAIGNKELVRKRRKAGPWDVAHPVGIIWAIMDRLIKKIARNKEPFVIERNTLRGEVSYSIKRKAKAKPTRPSSHAGTIRTSLLD